MSYDTQPIDSLVDEIKGTTRFISKIFSPPANFVFMAVILGALLAINFFFN
jgi:hypothetical protein